tara:strand:- start:18560 stop:18730 length:171 start_codon:yes stop_codon:yes gene_type:complete
MPYKELIGFGLLNLTNAFIYALYMMYQEEDTPSNIMGVDKYFLTNSLSLQIGDLTT